MGEVFRLRQPCRVAFVTSEARIMRKDIDLNDPFRDLAINYKKASLIGGFFVSRAFHIVIGL